MINELSRLLAEFHKSADRLNQVSDDINSVIGLVEKSIVGAKAGLECWLVDEPLVESAQRTDMVGDNPEPLHCWTNTELGFTKFDVGGWKLAVRNVGCTQSLDDGEQQVGRNPGEPKPLMSAPRNLRISALQSLPKLVELLTIKTNEAVAAIGAGNQIVNADLDGTSFESAAPSIKQ